MKLTDRHLVRGLATTAFVFALLAALLTSCSRGRHHDDDCADFALSAAELAPARPHPHPAARPRPAAHPHAAPARKASLHKAAAPHVIRPAAAARTTAPHPAPTTHVIHHVIVHTPAPRRTRPPAHHTVVHHHHDHHDHDLCD